MEATILSTPMTAWPPVAQLVRLDPPLQGQTFVAVMSNGPEFGATATYICPSTPDGLPKGTMMTALLRFDLCSTAEALERIGYSVVVGDV